MQPSVARPFRLIRYFSLLSLLAVAAVASLLAWVYGWNAERALLEQGQQKNLAQLQLIVNQWTDDDRRLVASLLALQSAPARDAAQVEHLASHFQAAIEGTSIRKLKLYTTAGLTVFSSERAQIGETKSDYPGFVASLHGTPHSDLSYRARFEAFGGAISDVYLIGSYLPVRNANGAIEGVIEIYDDVTQLALAIRETRWQVIGMTVVAMLLLYLALLAVVRRASWLQEHNRALERVVAERTRVAEETRVALQAAETARLDAERARAAADSANKAKSVFLATMSHEIRTPLNGVIGMTEILLSGAPSPAQRDSLQIIRSSALSLLRLLSDLLDYSRMESESVQLHETDFSPGAMLSEIVSSLRPGAGQRGIALDCRVGAGVPAAVRADEGRLRQVIGNLITNAMKFTHQGSVTVELEVDDSEPTLLRFVVRDTGIGIAAADLDRIFRPFEQADGSYARRYGGAGLGLSICRRLVELMGGRIGVQSEPGVGSTFWFTVRWQPAQAMPALAPVADDETPSFDACILVVEDNPVNQLVASRILAGLGCDVDVVGSGEEALKTVFGPPHHLILMDLHMGGIDGIETTRRLRAFESQHGARRVPVVALTADAFEQTRESCLAAGMDDVLVKPFTREAMVDLLRRTLPRRAAGLALAAAE